MNYRRDKILEIINESRFITIEELSNIIGVSENTIRRDIHLLDKEGKIIKIKGGSIIRGDYKKYRSGKDYLRKKSIAKLASSFIKDGDIIIIDGGTTTRQIIPSLANKKNITIFSQCLDILKEVSLLENPEITLLSVGGILDYKVNIFYGEHSSQLIKEYNFDKGFFSCTGIDLKNGVTNMQIPSYIHKNIIIKNSKDNFLLVDSSKFNKSSLKKVCELTDIRNLITDEDIDNEILKSYQKLIPNFYIANF